MKKISKGLLSVMLFAFALINYVPQMGVNAEELTIEKIKTINLTIAAPKIGDEVKAVTKESYGVEYQVPDKAPVVTLESGANYTIEATMFRTAANGLDDTVFYGTFDDQTDYYVEVALLPNDGYEFDMNSSEEQNNVTITVNGGNNYVLGQWYSPKGVIIYAKIKAEAATPKTFTVAFDTNGGTSVKSQTVESGKLATQPAAPTKEGYKFLGWYADKELTKEFSFTTPITEDTTVYGKWEVQTFAVSFEPNTGYTTSDAIVEYGKTVTKPYDYEHYKKGYYLEGWYTDKELTKPYDFTSKVTSNFTLYAKWAENTLIKEINLTIKNPVPGVEVKTVKKHDDEYNYDYETFEPKPTITINGQGGYEVGYTTYINAIPTNEDDSVDTAFTGIFEEGKDYYVEIWLIPNKGYEFDENATITVNGGKNYKLSEYVSETSRLIYATVTSSKNTSYVVLEGDSQLLTVEQPLSFRANIDYKDFLATGKVFVDDAEVASTDYVSSEGSTIITFTDAYKNTLKAGKHTFKITVADGEVNSSFTIVKKTNNPATGDNVQMLMTILTISLMGMIALIVYNKKTIKNN